MFPTFGIGNGNEKQCSQPKLGKNGLKSLGIKLGTGISSQACDRVLAAVVVEVAVGVVVMTVWLGTLARSS